MAPLFDHLALRECVRLGATSHELRELVYAPLLAWIARCKCRCEWARGVRMPSYTPTARSDFIVFASARASPRGSYMYHPRLPSHAKVVNQLNRKLCRECLMPCQTLARAASGRLVIVCNSCSLDRASYSAMCGRDEARRILRGKVPNVESALRRQHIARRGGNRAYLYWVHDLQTTPRACPTQS